MDNLPLEAGDDAGMVKWVDISEKLKLYANHSYFIKLVTEKWGAHWSEEPGCRCPEWYKGGTDPYVKAGVQQPWSWDDAELLSAQIQHIPRVRDFVAASNM